MEKAQLYRGIKFVRISNLPIDQRESIKLWLNNELIIKILKDDDQLLSDCLQYKHYEEWYTTVFTLPTEGAPSKEIVKSEGLKSSILVVVR